MIIMGKQKIGIVTFPLEKASVSPLYNISHIFSCLTDDIYVITGNAGIDAAQKLESMSFKIINHNTGSSTITRIFNYAKTQLTLTSSMLKLSKNVDTWVFPICGESLLPCMILAKLQQKPVIMLLPSSTKSIMTCQSDPLNLIILLFTKINYLLSTKIILYSPELITEWNLEKYRQKILIAYHHFLDLNTFSATIPLTDRPALIGYIGRLSAEKGIENFAQALPAILHDHQNFHANIGGDGPLKEEIKVILEEDNLTTRVSLLGWISHDDLPKYLNKFRLLVLPSYTEGLPNIMLEAMACGTPVLATPVGAIPDVIIDGKTGFIMENNSPECIAENVKRALSSPELERIAERGRQFVRGNYTLEHVMDRWNEVLEEL